MTERHRSLRESILYNDLVAILGTENVSRDEVECQAYVGDVSFLGMVMPRHDMEVDRPDFIVWPTTTEQVSRVLKVANTHKVPVTPYCGGAGVQGAAVPLFGGIVMDVKKMDKILEIDETNLKVTCQTGLIGQTLEWALNARGYTYAHIPQSTYCSGIGGFLAGHSAGVLSTKYGKIANMVLGMEVVLPTGRVMRTRAVPQSAAGPNLNHLFIGSEGTLGVITEVTLVIHPLPEVREFRSFLYPSMHSAFEAARKIMRRGLLPGTLRISDEEESKELYKQDGSFMTISFDGFEDLVALQHRETMKIAMEEKAVDIGSAPGDRWWNHRFSSVYPKDVGNPLEMGRHTLNVGNVIDSAGSFTYLEAAHREIRQALLKIPGGTFMAHFSHWYKTGGMMYPYCINTGAASDEEMVDRYFRMHRAAVEVIHRLGGTMTHHHGVGLTLRGFMRDEFGESFETLQSIKHTLDPNNIMNPGKLGFDWRE
jgi:alkyldihydroxyacetonephosphate synthase